MPLKIGEKSYVLPGENGTPLISGEETLAIEDEFGVDFTRLLQVLQNPNKEAPKGYTYAKVILALAWVCRSRSGEIVSLSDVIKDTAPGEVEIEEQDPKEEAKEVVTEN